MRVLKSKAIRCLPIAKMRRRVESSLATSLGFWESGCPGRSMETTVFWGVASLSAGSRLAFAKAARREEEAGWFLMTGDTTSWCGECASLRPLPFLRHRQFPREFACFLARSE